MKKPTRKPIRKISVNRGAQLAKYYALRLAFLKEHPLCRVCTDLKIEGMLVPLPHRISTDIHHTRGRVGRLLLATQFWIPVCREHHNLIHDHPFWAKSKGYIKDWLKTSDL